MKKTIIFILVIVILIAGWILYLYRDAVRNAYDTTNQEVSEDIQETKGDVSEGIQNIQEDISQ